MINFDDIKPRGAEEMPHKEAKDLVPKPLEETEQTPASKEPKLNISDYWNIVKALFRNTGVEIIDGKISLGDFNKSKLIGLIITAVIAILYFILQ
jgi:hypothetical protein